MSGSTVVAENEPILINTALYTSDKPLTSPESYPPLTLKNEKGQWLCGSHRSDGQAICISPYIQKNGRCKQHGGGTPAGPYSKHLAKDKDIAERVEQLKSDKGVLDITSHIALTTALLERAVDKLDSIEAGLDGGDALESAKAVGVISTNLTKMIETHHKIQVGYYYSPEKIKIILDMIAGTMTSYCKGCDKLQEVGKRIKQLPMPE